MKEIIKQYSELNEKASILFIDSIKENKYDNVWWDSYNMNFGFGEYTLSLWISNDKYGLKIESPFYINFTDEQKDELFEHVKIVKLTNKDIEFDRYSNDLYWKYNCVCGQKLGCTGYYDDNWWDNVAPKHELEDVTGLS